MSVFIQTKEPSDFNSFDRVHFLPDDFSVHENHFQHYPPYSFIIMDDFSFKKANNKQEKLEFLKVINYHLRHRKITLVLIVHNMYNTNLANDILMAPHLILSYSNLGYEIMRYTHLIFIYRSIFLKVYSCFFVIRKIAGRLGGPPSLAFYQEPLKQNYHFCYINCLKNYMINKLDYLLQKKDTTMFLDNTIYVIHNKDQPCGQKIQSSSELSSKKHVIDFIKMMYPKQKFLTLVFEPMVQQELINDDLFFKDHPQVHIADFCSFINNRFAKNNFPPKITKLCKYLNAMGLRFPKVSIKNAEAQKMLC